VNTIGDGERNAWAAAADPAGIFLRMWRLASSWSPAERMIIPGVLLQTRDDLATASGERSGSAAVAAIVAVVAREWPGGATENDRMTAAGLVMATMRAIEDTFASTHPRTRVIAAATIAPTRPPAWIDAAQRRRLRVGSFAEDDALRLIPSGPFARHARGRDASSADSLRDHFAFLTVAPLISVQEDRTITIEMKVIGTDIMRGVSASASIGRERIRFIPLAEEPGDLHFAESHRGDQLVLDVRPAIDTKARLLAALTDGDDVDIAFSPELTLGAEDEEELARGIAALAEHAPRIILAGSGLTVDRSSCGRSWNEARVFARGGKVLWRHRKIWPFGMQSGAAKSYGLADPGADRMLMEDIAADDRITVVDLDGFGRCIVLICQDFQSHPVIDQVVARYQPDWVLTPVLDPGVKVPGWAHQRAEVLSHLSQARLLVGSSLTMSHMGTLAGDPEPAIGLAVGPFESADGANPGRALAIVRAAAGPSPRSGVLVWDHDPSAWRRTTVGSS